MKDLSYYTKQMNITLSEKQLEQFDTYMNMVIEKNQVMNLTAITDPEEFALKHFADSLSLIPAVPELKYISEKPVTMVDVGTGAGFPSVPLKIAYPNIQLTLLDSLNKRISFLDSVISTLGLENVTTIHARAEEGGRRKDLRDTFEVVTSRAVANLSTLTEYCLPYAKVGGLFVSYKSGNIDEELESAERAIKLLGGKLEDVIHFQLADTDNSRSFVLIRKEKPTPKAYPRKPGTAKREPL